MSGTMPNTGYAPWVLEGGGAITVSQTGLHVRISDEGSAFALAQTTWFIDPVGGSDRARGTAEEAPIKTHAELMRRLGRGIINTNVIVYLMNDFGLDNPVYIDVRIGNAGTLSYHGIKTPTVLHSGTFTAVTPELTAPNEALVVEDTSIPVSWTASDLINTQHGGPRRIRVTGGANEGLIGWAGKDLGVKTARISGMIKASTSNLGTVPTLSVTPNVGDPYVVETGFVKIADFRVTALGSGVAEPFGPLPDLPSDVKLFFLDIDLLGEAAVPGGPPITQPTVFFQQSDTDETGAVISCMFSRCDIGRLSPVACSVFASACKLSGAANLVHLGRLILGAGLVTQVLTLEGAAGRSFLGIYANTLFDAGGGLIVGTAGVLLSRVSIFDRTGDSLTLTPGGSIRDRSNFGQTQLIYGKDNTGYGIRAMAGGLLAYDGAANEPTVTGTLGDTIIGGIVTAYAGIPFANTTTTGFGAAVVITQ